MTYNYIFRTFRPYPLAAGVADLEREQLPSI